ncbi:hypothetical protein BOV88_13705 [Solemya velum gill symbiont]|uniref:Uncharacterized protein n=1 Tax=Solemya velum gill symbiont TaxID=2340 RepID=A0A1T2CG15_SOVGS|nr:hypothetical protein BOV88_13705 [Solemya velum gill symbiont]
MYTQQFKTLTRKLSVTRVVFREEIYLGLYSPLPDRQDFPGQYISLDQNIVKLHYDTTKSFLFLKRFTV